jgi:hypothetical protein
VANTSLVQGFIPAKYLNGVEWNGQFRIYFHSASDASAIGVGDPVMFDSTNYGDPTGRFPAVKLAGANDIIVGVAIGFGTVPTGIQGVAPVELYDPANLVKAYAPASTANYIAVVDDPNVLFEVQENSSPSALTIAALMNSISSAVGAVNVNSGLSGFTIDSNTASAYSSSQTWRLMRLVDRMDNALGQYAKWYVSPLLHVYRASIAGL